MTQSFPIYNLPYLYVSGFQTKWISGTHLSIVAGQCRDSTNVIDMPLGGASLNGYFINTPVILNASLNGINGLDRGSLANNTWYSIYIIGDSNYNLPVATLLSLTTNVYPLLPNGYDAIRLIGYVLTDGSANFLPFYQGGNGSQRYYQFGTPIQVVSGATATGFTTFSLIAAVPPISTPVYIYAEMPISNLTYTAGLRITGSSPSTLANLSVQFRPAATSGTIFVTQPFKISSVVNNGNPQLDYFITTTVSSDSLSLFVTAFDFYV